MAQVKSNPLVYLFGKTWQYSAGNRLAIVKYWSCYIGAQGIDIFALPLIWASVMNITQQQGITLASIKILAILLALTLLAELGFWAFHGPGRLLERRNAFKARASYRKHLLRGVFTLPLEWHASHHSGDTIDKIEKGTTALYEFSGNSFEIIQALLQLVGSYAVLAYFSPPAAGIVLAMILVTMWITMRFDRVLIGQYEALSHAENHISESVFDAVSNISTVVILRVEKLIFEAIARKIENPFGLFKRNNYLNEMKWFLTNMCCVVMTILVLGVYFWQHLGTASGILIGSVYLLIQYLQKMSQLFFRFTSLYGDVLQRKARVLNAEELSRDFKAGTLTNHVLPPHWRELAIRNLNFSYDAQRESPHLDDVSLTLRHGERIAFVGETGSGKTTCLKVMRDLYHSQTLRLSVDGKDIPHGFDGISRAIALVPQNPEIFATTIGGNITLGADYPDAFVKRFTDMACFSEVVAGLPRGLDSSVKEKGVNLSGGQQQRLALARGLLACDDKDIVLLDEPTSSLDAGTEMRVYRNIFEGFKGKTILSSIHRLHLLPLFDRVCMFEKGKIIASGSLEELLASCPQFQTLWNAMQHVAE